MNEENAVTEPDVVVQTPVDDGSTEPAATSDGVGADDPGTADQADGESVGAAAATSGAQDAAGADDALEAEGDVAADYLEELLDIADLDGDIDINVEGGRAHVSIVTSGADAEKLVGRKGEVLDALQELARLAVMTETGHRSRLMLDIGGHRDRRRAELTTLAEEAIAEVKQTGEPSRLNPMNPFERKIVHDVVAAAGMTSESEGVEPKRFVVVLPK